MKEILFVIFWFCIFTLPYTHEAVPEAEYNRNDNKDDDFNNIGMNDDKYNDDDNDNDEDDDDDEYDDDDDEQEQKQREDISEKKYHFLEGPIADEDQTHFKRSTAVNIKVVREDKECLYGHNVLRDIHTVPKLKWDPNLAYEAEKWAIHNALLDNGASHSTFIDKNGNHYGENIYYSGGASRQHKNCHDAIWMWHRYLIVLSYIL